MNIIELNKNYSKIINIAESKIKPTNCPLCGRAITSCCNSHTIPQFILENLMSNAEFYNAKEFMNLEDEYKNIITKSTTGKNRAQTFHLICRECDSKCFKTYETTDIFNEEITESVLFEIFLKNLLYNEYIEKKIYYFYKYIKDNFELNLFNIKNFEEVKKQQLLFINERMAYSEIMLNNISLKRKSKVNLEIIHFELLEYTVPIAFQDIVKIEFDFKNNTINNLHSLNRSYKYSFLNICIFPYKNKSLVLMFYDKNDTILNNFALDFKKLTNDEKKIYILYFIFKYNDTFLISKHIKHKIYIKNKIKSLVDLDERDNFDWFLRFSNLNPESIKNSLKNIPDIPNLLDEKYKI